MDYYQEAVKVKKKREREKNKNERDKENSEHCHTKCLTQDSIPEDPERLQKSFLHSAQ